MKKRGLSRAGRWVLLAVVPTVLSTPSAGTRSLRTRSLDSVSVGGWADVGSLGRTAGRPASVEAAVSYGVEASGSTPQARGESASAEQRFRSLLALHPTWADRALAEARALACVAPDAAVEVGPDTVVLGEWLATKDPAHQGMRELRQTLEGRWGAAAGHYQKRRWRGSAAWAEGMAQRSGNFLKGPAANDAEESVSAPELWSPATIQSALQDLGRAENNPKKRERFGSMLEAARELVAAALHEPRAEVQEALLEAAGTSMSEADAGSPGSKACDEIAAALLALAAQELAAGRPACGWHLLVEAAFAQPSAVIPVLPGLRDALAGQGIASTASLLLPLGVPLKYRDTSGRTEGPLVPSEVEAQDLVDAGDIFSRDPEDFDFLQDLDASPPWYAAPALQGYRVGNPLGVASMGEDRMREPGLFVVDITRQTHTGALGVRLSQNTGGAFWTGTLAPAGPGVWHASVTEAGLCARRLLDVVVVRTEPFPEQVSQAMRFRHGSFDYLIQGLGGWRIPMESLSDQARLRLWAGPTRAAADRALFRCPRHRED